MTLKHYPLRQAFALATLVFTLTACNNQDEQAASTNNVVPTSAGITSTGTPTPTPKPTATPRPTATPKPTATPTPGTGTYPSCVNSDPNHICIGLKLISYQDSSGVPVMTEADAITLVDGMNALWSQCNIAFQLEVFQIIDPAAQGLSYSPPWKTETYTIREKFADKTRFLVAAVGPWSGATIAVTTMPESGTYGTVVDKQYSHNPLTVGHELGHYQGLYHVDDTSNLMSAYIGSNTKALTTAQCTTSRNTDVKDWPLMMRKP